MKRRKKAEESREKAEESHEKVVEREDDFLIRLNCGESVVLQCRSVVTITVLSGTVEALGATLTPTHGSLDALSPPNGSVLKLVASDLEPFGTHTGQVAVSIKPPSMDDISLASFDPEDPVQCLVDVPAWSATVDQVLAKNRVSVAVMGAKGTGKSTFTRYCVNRLLQKHRQVCYIDTDIGQPEFTAPGVVSLTIVDRPLLYTEGAYSGILRTHEVQHCYFVGALTPSENPLLYLDALRKVAERYVSDFAALPLVVNTMGWVIGLGVHMVHTILDIAKVEVLVRLGDIPGDADPNVFLEYFDFEESADRTVINVSNKELQAGREIRTRSTAAFELRWFRFLFHFRPDIRSIDSQGQSMASFFGRCTAQRIPRSSLRFAFQESVDEEEVEVALIGVLVALARTGRGQLGVSTIDAAHEVICFALVHSFLDDAAILYTPTKILLQEDEELLLLRGPLFWSPAKRTDEIEPYNCASCITGLSSGSKVNSTRNVPRKRMMGQ